MAGQTVDDVHRQGKKTERPDFHVGLIGRGIQLSRTPKMHEGEAASLGINYCYDLIDTETFDGNPGIADLLSLAEKRHYRGVNITYPFKKTVLPFLDGLSDAAKAIGAVNTVLFRDGKRYGHNTDYWGFAEAFKHYMADVTCNRVLLIGAGGAGAAIANALIDRQTVHLAIYDKSHQSSLALVNHLCASAGESKVSLATDLIHELSLADGFVNATPLGMASHKGTPVALELIHPRHWVADIIYFPLETELLASARAIGCKVMDGSGMAVFQAVRAFELFTGLKPDSNRMRATFDAFNH